MKQLSSIPAICLFLSITACKKNSSGNDIPPGNPNNELKATVSVGGGNTVSINANGNNTIFGRTVYANGTTALFIAGYNDDLPNEPRSVRITLGNISAPGTYKFVPELTPGSTMYSYCGYEVGNPFSPSESYTTFEHDSTSTITITNITATHIAGSIASVTCGNATKEIQVKNVSFKGEFE